MHDTSEKYLLQINPRLPKSGKPVNDELTVKMEKLLESSDQGTSWRGFHNCTSCGKMSGYCDLIVGGYITNSLAAHYLRWHRNDVPESELDKLARINL